MDEQKQRERGPLTPTVRMRIAEDFFDDWRTMTQDMQKHIASALKRLREQNIDTEIMPWGEDLREHYDEIYYRSFLYLQDRSDEDTKATTDLHMDARVCDEPIVMKLVCVTDWQHPPSDDGRYFDAAGKTHSLVGRHQDDESQVKDGV